jgi:mitotic spindle assembly checkpoint protein MAD2B
MQFEFVESFDELIEGFCVFMGTFIHQILYSRQLYPSEIFGNRTEFGVGVQYCNHPSVIDFVKKAVESLNPLLRGSLVEKIFISILGKNCLILEQFTLSFVWLMGNFPSKDTISFPRHELENIFRDFLSKIKASENFLGPTPKGATINLFVRTRKKISFDGPDKLTKFEPLWKVCEPNDFVGSFLILKVHSTSLFQVQLLIENRR